MIHTKSKNVYDGIIIVMEQENFPQGSFCSVSIRFCSAGNKHAEGVWWISNPFMVASPA
jgi:hypothetical protein